MRSKFKWIFTLLMALTMQFSFAQEKTITGTVSDATGPLPGVNVVVQGTTRGVQTNFDGSYSIKAKEGEKLVYSFMGMGTITRAVGASTVMNVTMQDDTAKELKEVVVTAVGIKKTRESITTSTELVKAKELTQANNPNAISALSGKVSGLQIVNTGNGVNQNNKIQLRAPVSITGDNNALIVIDNAISDFGVLSRIPAENIESINVIKGKQGAALYGSDGRAGVIVVTTKKGTSGDKIKVAVTSSVDFEDVNFIAQRQTRYGQGWSGSHVSYENGAWGAEMDGTIKAVGLLQADGTYIMSPYSPIKDNIKKFFNTGTVLQNNISISGGNTDTGYVNFTFNRQDTDFVVKGDELRRYGLTFKGGKKIGKFTIEGTVLYTDTKTSTTTQTLLTELYQAATNIPVQRFENSGNEGAWTSYYRNPYWLRDNVRFNDARYDVLPTFNLNYELNKNINFNYLANFAIKGYGDIYYRNAYVDANQVGGGDHSTISQMDQTNFNSRKFYSDFMVNFNYDLMEGLNFKSNIGLNNQTYNFSQSYAGGDNLVIPGFYNLSNITGIPRVNAVATAYNGERTGANIRLKRRSFGVFANVDLNYKDFLYLNITGRNDWDSRLTGPKTPTNNYLYPSVGMSFIPTNLEALKDGKILSSAKFTASWVKTGNVFGGDDGIYNINEVGQVGLGYPFGTLNSFGQLTNITNPALKPEFTETTEFSAKLGFLNNRISLGGAYYMDKNTDLITNITSSSTSGLQSLITNIGQLDTKGYEIDLEFTPVKTENFTWNNSFGYSSYKSEVVKVTDQSNEVALQDNGEVGIFAVKGEEFPLIKGTAYARDPQGRVIIDAATGNPVRANEYKVLGKSTPDYILNYSGYVDYKGLRLGVVMDYRTGHQFYSGTKDWLSWSGHLYESAINGRTGFIYPNSVIETSPGVYQENTSVVTGGTTYSSFLSYFQDEYADIAENSVLDATALKIREIALSYTLPSKLIESTKLASVRFGVSARNPFIFLPKENRGYSDPEFSNTARGNAIGISNVGKYPQTRTIGFNVNVTF